MGQGLAAPAGCDADFTLRVRNAGGGRVDIVIDGRHQAALSGASLASDDAVLTFQLPADGARHWVRADVRSADGQRIVLIGNPIYLTPLS